MMTTSVGVEHNRRQIDYELEPMKADVRDIKLAVHHIEQNKQDRIKPSVIITIILYLVSQLIVGIWWAAETSERLNQVLTKIDAASIDRFYGKDGAALKEYTELSISLLKKELEFQDNRINTYLSEHTRYKAILDSLAVEHAKFQQQLLRVQDRLSDYKSHKE